MSRAKAKGLVLIDLFIFLYMSFLIYISLVITSFTMDTFSYTSSDPAGAFLGFIIFLMSYIFIPSFIYISLPTLKEGKHSFPSSKISGVWILKFYIKKPLTLPIISNIIYSFHFLSYFILKLHRSQVTTNFQIAANAELRDPELIVLHDGVTIGSDTILAPHKMTPTHLELYKITIEKNVSIGAFCKIAPGVHIKEGTRIGNNVILHSHAVVESNCVIADCVSLKENSFIGEKSIIKAYSIIDKREKIKPKSIIDNMHRANHDSKE